MKNLEQIQEENRKFIILANNPEAKDYKEALEMELGNRCAVEIDGVDIEYIGILHWFRKRKGGLLGGDKIQRDDIVHIWGKPLDLSRVLIALNKTLEKDINWEFSSIGNKFFIGTNNYNLSILFKDWIKERPYWDLTKPTLEEQIEETQRAINKLIKAND